MRWPTPTAMRASTRAVARTWAGEASEAVASRSRVSAGSIQHVQRGQHAASAKGAKFTRAEVGEPRGTRCIGALRATRWPSGLVGLQVQHDADHARFVGRFA